MDFTPVNEIIARGSYRGRTTDKQGRTMIQIMVNARRQKYLFPFYYDKRVDADIKPYDHVLVRAYANGFKFFNQKRDREEWILCFVATSLEKDTPELTARLGVPGIITPEPDFRCYISGVVDEAFRQPEVRWGKLIVKTRGEGQEPSLVALNYYIGGRLPVFDYRPGEAVVVRASGHVAEKRFPNNNRIVYPNLTVEDVAFYTVPDRLRGTDHDPDRGYPIDDTPLAE